jgi:hypothetical protein
VTREFVLGTSLRRELLCRNLWAPSFLIFALLLGLMLALPAETHADTYTYTGSALGVDPSVPTPITDFTNITGYFTISGALGDGLTDDDITSSITNFSFSSGPHQTITYASAPSLEDFVVNTNATGQIIDWAIELGNASGSILSCWDVPQVNPYPSAGPGKGDCEIGTGFGGSGDEAQYAGEVGLVVPGAGAWATPEPSSSLMLGAGLLGLIVMARRKQFGETLRAIRTMA